MEREERLQRETKGVGVKLEVHQREEISKRTRTSREKRGVGEKSNLRALVHRVEQRDQRDEPPLLDDEHLVLRIHREVAERPPRVQGSGCGVQGSGCGVQGSGCGVQGSGFEA